MGNTLATAAQSICLGLGVAAESRNLRRSALGFLTKAHQKACSMAKREDKAQAYAMRVWEGQSHTVPRAERIARVHKALEGQGLPAEGVVLPETGPDWQEPDAVPPDYPPAVRGGDSEVSDALAYAVEKWANEGRLLDWRHWLVTLHALKRAQAVRLLNGLHPRTYADLRIDPNIREYDTRQAREIASNMEEAAEDHGIESATPREWLQWANEHFPGGFRSRFAEKLAELCPADTGGAALPPNPIDPAASKPRADHLPIKRQDPMRALIVRVMAGCDRPDDAHLVWALLMDLAKEARTGGGRNFPLTGEIKDNSEIGWVSNRGGKTKWLDMQAFKERHRKLLPANQNKAR